MTIDQILTWVAFAVMASIALGGGLMVAAFRNVLHAALALMLSFMGVAGLYVLLEAEFIAATQVLVYVGAISILIVFAVMLTRGLMTKGEPSQNSQWIAAAGVAAILFGVLFFVAVGTAWPQASTALKGDLILELGKQLVDANKYGYLLPFEVVSLLLLGALVGAIVIAREKE